MHTNYVPIKQFSSAHAHNHTLTTAATAAHPHATHNTPPLQSPPPNATVTGETGTTLHFSVGWPPVGWPVDAPAAWPEC